MSSDAATIGLTFDGNDIQDLDGLYLEITAGLDDSPAVRGEDVTVPYADGQTARPRRFHERRLLLTGFVRGVGSSSTEAQADYRANAYAMTSLFDPAADPADLVAILEDGQTATCAARTLSIATVKVIPSEFTNVSIEMLAVEDWTYELAGS